MNTKRLLIISDAGNQYYWNELTREIKDKIGAVRIVLDNEISLNENHHLYDLIVMDVSNLDILYRLIPEIHLKRPESQIIVTTSTPTWKQTREVIRLGAVNLIRKTPDTDEMINELNPD